MTLPQGWYSICKETQAKAHSFLQSIIRLAASHWLWRGGWWTVNTVLFFIKIFYSWNVWHEVFLGAPLINTSLNSVEIALKLQIRIFFDIWEVNTRTRGQPGGEISTTTYHINIRILRQVSAQFITQVIMIISLRLPAILYSNNDNSNGFNDNITEVLLIISFICLSKKYYHPLD